jgi:hypothetical protein
VTASDGGAGGARRDEKNLGIANAFVAGHRGAQPERADVTASDGGAGGARRDEDAAVVVAVLAAVAARAAEAGMTPPPPRSVWATGPARTVTRPGPHAWWSSGLDR